MRGKFCAPVCGGHVPWFTFVVQRGHCLPCPTRPPGFSWEELQGVTSRFPRAFRRTLWVMSTVERAENGRVRSGRVRFREEPSEPQIVQTSLSTQGRERCEGDTQDHIIIREGPDTCSRYRAEPQPHSNRRGGAEMLPLVPDKTKAPKGQLMLRYAQGSPPQAQEGPGQGRAGGPAPD